MYKSSILLLFSLLFCLGLKASEIGHRKIEKPLLYAVQKDGKTSFIMGTIHVQMERSNIPEFVKQAQKSVPITAVEQDIVAAYDLFFPEMRTQQLPDDIFKALEKRGVYRFILESAPIQMLCPIYVQWHLLQDGNYLNMIDAQFQSIAEELGKTLVWLDTDEDLNQRSYHEIYKCDYDQLRLLLEKLPPEKADELQRIEIDKVFKEYSQGKDRFTHDKDPSETSFERNELWFKQLDQLHSQGFFAAFGSNHIGYGYQRGLHTLFLAHGYKVTRIDTAEKYKQLQSD